MPAAALPLDAHEGIPAIGITGEFVATGGAGAQPAFAHDPTRGASVGGVGPLMTLFTSVDAFWVERGSVRRIGGGVYLRVLDLDADCAGRDGCRRV